MTSTETVSIFTTTEKRRRTLAGDGVTAGLKRPLGGLEALRKVPIVVFDEYIDL